MLSLLFVGSLLSVSLCQDPASSWLGYAKGVNPDGTGVITFAEAYWVVPDNPVVTGKLFI